MKNYLIDTHSHIDMIEESPDTIIKEMIDNRVRKAIIPSVEVSTMEKIIDIAKKYDEIFAMVGIYPSEAKTYNDEVEKKNYSLRKIR